MNILDQVVTMSEACKLIGITQQGMSKKLLAGKLDSSMYRKADGGGYLFIRSYVDKLKAEKEAKNK